MAPSITFYDENASDNYELKVYLDGQLSGFSSELGGLLQVKPSDQWLLGAASKIDPINGRFLGRLDDMRFYSSESAELLARETFNDGNGDLSLSIDAQFPPNTHDNSISAHFTFKKYGVEYDVSDFNESESVYQMECWIHLMVRVPIGRSNLIQPLIRGG